MLLRFDVAGLAAHLLALLRRGADVMLLGMATGESVACLNHLMRRGEASREIDDGGVAWYRLAE